MKNLANCSPREFLVQTNKIRHSVSSWLDLTRVLEIRKNLPKFSGEETADEKKALLTAQIQKNFSAMLDSMLEEHAEETVSLLGLLCFVDVDDIDNHPMREYLSCLNEMLECPEVFGFFTSLMRLGRTNTSGSAKASG